MSSNLREGLNILKTNTSKVCRLAGGDGVLKSMDELQYNSFYFFTETFNFTVFN